MECARCPHCNSLYTVRNGSRKTRKGITQRYLCNNCNRFFSSSILQQTQYPAKVILFALTQYNLGHPLSHVKKRIQSRFKTTIPDQTFYSWTSRYQPTLTFLKTRKRYKPDPQNLLTLHRLDHLQVYPFTYHNLKLNLAGKSFPQLRRYINYIERALPHELFMEGPRASSTRIQTNFKIVKRNNIAPELCRLALATRKTNESPHNAVENFFLINDSTTICKELPVFLKEGENHHIKTHLTGHIDLIQVRFGKLYILDYKPNLKKPGNYASQMYFYKEAVHKRTRIPRNKIVPASFNRYAYYEYV